MISGESSSLLICLHGYGENAQSFAKLQSTLGGLYTIIALDMPLHGQTEWNEARPFEKADLHAVIRLLLEQQQKFVFSLMGYSMGGRLALCLLEELADQVQELFLVAADGLRDNPWHRFVTRTSIGNWLFKQVTYHPRPFFWLLNTCHSLRLINASIYKFVQFSMDKLEKREKVYLVWTLMRNMKPDRKLCRRLLARYKVHTLLIFGRYDRVIPSVVGIRFMDGTFPCEMLVLEKGHQLISEELGETIIDKL